MYETFETAYRRDVQTAAKTSWWRRSPTVDFRSATILEAFRDELGGASFGQGLYRTVSNRNHAAFIQRVADVFPAYSGRVFPLAFDWLNRMICADFERTVQSHPLVLILSHLTNEVTEIPVTVDAFHNDDLVQHRNQLLEADMFHEFLRLHGLSHLSYTACAGLSIPLFLGGEYSVDNLEVNDTDVEWSVTAQLLRQVQGVENGAVIGSVRIA
jgi:hypothetical protein